jgi:hypothetical protein
MEKAKEPNVNNVLIEASGAGGGGLQLIFKRFNFIRVNLFPAALTHDISRGRYLPCKIYCPVLASLESGAFAMI